MIECPKWVRTLYKLTNESNTYYLNNSDFINGTYRIRNPGKYILTENIVFHPNPKNNFKPYENQKDLYNSLTYALGFFAAITVESDNVTIDLNNFSIKQSEQHYKNQRFYANIELGSSPFIPNKGPANFGNEFVNCNYVVIQNGSLKLSSHHGIHGNNSSNLVFKNLIIDDYEVGGISLNGCNNILCDNIILATVNSVDFNHRFVHLLICKPLIEKLYLENVGAELNGRSITSIIDEMNETINNVSGIAKNNHTFVDGNAYGLSFNGQGPVIGPFKSKPESYTAYNIFVNEIRIKSIKTAVEEVPGYKREYIENESQNEGYNMNIQKGPIGQIFNIKDVNQNNKYSGNILSDIQVILAKYSVISSLDQSIINWVDNNKSINIEESRFIYGLDNMNHTMKGNIGIFFSNVKDGIIQNIIVEEMINNAPLKYTVSNAHNNNAIAIVGSENIYTKNINSKNLQSIHGQNKQLF